MRASFALWLLLVPVLACGCRAQSIPGEQKEASAAPEADALPPIILPDLTSVSGPVHTQIQTRFNALGPSANNSGGSDTDRAHRYAELGHVLLAATFFDEAVLC